MKILLKSIKKHAYLALILLGGLSTSGVLAGEVTSLKWNASGGIQIHVTGSSKYNVSSFEQGQRLRLSLPGSTLAAGAKELEGSGVIKGVYPYLADNGNAVNIDLLTTKNSSLDVNKTNYGFLVTLGGDSANEAVAVVQTAAEPSGASNTIEEIVYTKLPGSRVQLRLKMASTPTKPKSFTIANPARIALDFQGVDLKAQKNIRVGVGALVSVNAIQASGRTRVILNLVRPVSYETGIVDNTLVLTLDSPVTTIAAAQEPKSTHFATRKPGRFAIKNIDFRRGPTGDAKIIVALSDPSVGIDIKEQAGDIILDFLSASLPKGLERRLDVVDFATPVQTIDVFMQGENTRMVITPTGKYEHLAYQAGNTFTLNVKPVIEDKEKEKVDEFGYRGEKLSLNFQNIDVRAALQVLADFTDLNFVVSDTVSGNLTLRLKDVPWDQALDIILDTKALAMRRKGNVITVAPADEVAAREKAAFEASKVAIELEPLVSELIQVNYAKASDIAKLLKSIKAITTGVGGHPVFGEAVAITKESTESNTLLSPRGQVTVDTRTNSLLIQDTPGKIREVRKLIVKLDQPIRQVMIESRLVEATENFSKTLGAKFGIRNNNTGSTLQIDQQTSLGFDGTLLSGDGLNVDLPSPGIGNSLAGSVAVTLAKLGTGALLGLELSALESEGQGKIISSPRIVTANGQTAKIEQGQERVFTTSVLGVGTVVTKKAVLKLEVTPRITPDERVIMDVIVAKDNFADAIRGVLNIKEVETQVLLDNGETVVIGGIYELDQNETDNRVPFFGDLPLLGWLFKNKESVDSKTELLIFLTPRILAETVGLN
ncbi:MAG: type 4a pilus secretin PilQ [Gammaproteobacteria bacterium]|nr:MAG: type 4a pilus secretin PilQ [Gammaproteobacteria bacterium]